METLINKNNPQIRITAEVETLYDKSRCVKYYYIKDLRLGLLQENWTLVEEEPKHTEVWVEGRAIFEQDAKKPEVDLEKALNGLDNAYFDLDGIAVKGATYYLTVNDLKDIARDFYELGRKGGKI